MQRQPLSFDIQNIAFFRQLEAAQTGAVSLPVIGGEAVPIKYFLNAASRPLRQKEYRCSP
jgi:hypothetical protein